MGITFNFLLAALTLLLLGVIFGVRGSFSSPDLLGIQTVPIGPLANVPLLGPAWRTRHGWYGCCCR